MAVPFDSGFDLLPADGPDVTTDELLAQALGVLPDPLTEDTTPQPFGRGWAFDWATGQFHRHNNQPVAVFGLDNLTVWVEKALRTARLAHPIYSDDYGMEYVEIVGHPFEAGTAGLYANAVRDALLVHDRIERIKDFKFSYDPDVDEEALQVMFTVVLDAGSALTVGPLTVGGLI